MPEKDADNYRFDVLDITKVWPHSDYPLVKVGKLTLNRNPENYHAEIEQSAFAPSHLVPGIEPSNDIRIKVMALQGKGEVFQDINMPFYVEIDIDRRIIAPDEKRSGFGPLPTWFIDTCRRLEDYMIAEGFKILPSIRYGTDWENFETLDELAEQQSLIYKVKLEFIKK